MKKKIKQFWIGVFFFLLPIQYSAHAEIWGEVYDEAGLLTEEEGMAIDREIADLKEKTGWNIYVVTTADAGGKEASAYADDFFDSHSTEKEDGAALLIDMDNREIYISTCGETIRYLTDSRLELILDDAYAEVSEERYADCFIVMLDGLGKYYEKGIPNGQYNYDTQTGEISAYHSITSIEALTAAAAAIIVFFAVYFGTVGKYRLKFNNASYDFRRFGEIKLEKEKDILINSVVTHRHIPKNENGGSSHHGSSGRSSTHHSSSGRSHGGSGRKF